MTLAISSKNFINLNDEEMLSLDGGVDWGALLGGLGTAIAIIALVAVVPAAAIGCVGVTFLTGGSFISGLAIGYGATH